MEQTFINKYNEDEPQNIFLAGKYNLNKFIVLDSTLKFMLTFKYITSFYDVFPGDLLHSSTNLRVCNKFTRQHYQTL